MSTTVAPLKKPARGYHDFLAGGGEASRGNVTLMRNIALPFIYTFTAGAIAGMVSLLPILDLTDVEQDVPNYWSVKILQPIAYTFNLSLSSR
jgi:hypothetical protein